MNTNKQERNDTNRRNIYGIVEIFIFLKKIQETFKVYSNNKEVEKRGSYLFFLHSIASLFIGKERKGGRNVTKW